MGNAIQKRFNLPTNHTATAGHVNNWKIWPGKGKEGGQLVSIWAFDKMDLTKRKHNPVADKTIVEQVFQIMKRDFTVIKDSKACSNIIQIIEVIDESKNSIAFTTERIVCSLADVLNNFENIPGGAAEHASFFESGAALSEMEITRGLLNITLALQYLHTVQRKLHLNLTPEDIVITATGQWKLCGFGFALAFQQGETQRLASPYFMQACPITTTSVVSRLEPDLRYAAPECTEGGFNPPGVRYLTPVADMFALGVVFYEIYRFNLKLTPPERSYSRPLIMITNNDALQHVHAMAILQGTDYSFMPQGAGSIVSSLMNPNAQFRGTTTDIVNNSYFVTGSQAVLNMIESMHTRDLGTQSSQLLSLQSELANFPPRMLIHSVIPAISKLCIHAPNLWVYALPLHAELSALLTQDKYVYFAGPYVAQGLNNLEAPNDTLQVFLSSVQFISRYFGSDFFQANVTTLFCNALEKPNLYLQLIQQSKDKNIASNYGLITGSYKLFSGERINTATNSGANSAYTITAPTAASVKYAPMNSSGLAPANIESGKINLSAYDNTSYGATTAGGSGSGGGGYGSTASAYSAPSTSNVPPPAPTRAPPPPPSAPPPSTLPPSLPVAGTVGGFGADVNSVPLGPAASSSISYGSNGTSTPAVSAYGGSYGASSTSNASYVSPSAAGSGMGGYQPNFGSANTKGTAMPSSTSPSYGAPLTPLDGGPPNFGSTATLTPANASTTTTSNDSEKKSMFSFFSGSKKPEQKDSLMDASGADLYKPPVVSGANFSSSNSSGLGSTGVGSSGGGGGVPDLDDFLSSFGNSAPANTMGGTMGNKSTAPVASTPAYNSTANTGGTAPYNAPYNANMGSAKSTSSVTSTTSGLSIEQQIAQAQLEIARLSTTNSAAPAMNTMNSPQTSYGAPVNSAYSAPASSAWPTQPAAQQYSGYGANPNAVPNSGMNNNMYSNPAMAGAGGYVPPQPYTAQYQPSNSYTTPSANTYAPPAAYGAHNAAAGGYNQGAVPGYSYNAGVNNTQTMYNNMNQNMNTGYLPPQPGNANNGAPKPKNDAFDFLS
eukprot:gene8250-9815_t